DRGHREPDRRRPHVHLDRLSALRLELPVRLHQSLEERAEGDRGPDPRGRRASLWLHGERFQESSRGRLMPAGATAPAWVGSALAGWTDWIRPISMSAAAECEAALAHVRRRGLRWPDFDRDDFPLPTFSGELDVVLDELENGRGLVLLRGFPVDRWAAED